jgi:uncharacterized membrane protein
MRRLIVLVALALSACGADSRGNPPPPPAATPTVRDYSQDLVAHGATPSWNLSIRGTQLTLTRPNQPDLIGVAPGAVIQATQAQWTAKTPEGQTLVATLYASGCTDPVSGASSTFSAEVDVPGEAPLIGCADKARGKAR